MTKKTSLTNHTIEDLNKLAADKREELRALRFSVAGSKNRNVKQGSTLRKEIARALTELNNERHKYMETKTVHKKTFRGTVVSDKMQDTAVVSVSRYVKHPKYKKYMKITKKYHAHNPGNRAKRGDGHHPLMPPAL
jgi:ribosomal protein L29